MFRPFSRLARTGRAAGLATAAVAVTALTLGVAGCGSDAADKPSSSGSSAASAAFPVTVGPLTLAKQPQHIISLSPTATETLFDIGAGKQVVAVDDQSNFPPEAPKSDLSGFKPNVEAIAGKKPDLVVLSDDMDKIVEQLGKINIPVYLAPAAKNLDGAYRQWSDLGRLTGHAAEADDVVKRAKDDIAKLVKDAPKKSLTYFYEVSPDGYSAASNTLVGSLFTQLGLKNVADAVGGDYPQLNAEAVVKANPDLIFLADTKCCQQTPDTVKARAGWGSITAVQKNQVYPLDDDIASRWSPRVVDLVRTIVGDVAKA